MALLDLIMIKQECQKIYNNLLVPDVMLNVLVMQEKNQKYLMTHKFIQKWGGNLMGVYNGHPIDESDLKNVGRKLSKYCKKKVF